MGGGGDGEEARHSMGGGGEDGEEARHSVTGGGGGRWRGSET